VSFPRRSAFNTCLRVGSFLGLLTIVLVITPRACHATWQHFGVEVGFRDVFMGTIFEDRSETLWFGHPRLTSDGSAGGVSSYDGIRWTHYNGYPGPAAPHFVTSFADANDGGVWAADDRGLMKFKDGSWTVENTPKWWTPPVATIIYSTRNGDLWVGGDGLLRLRGSVWSDYTSASGLTVTTIKKIFEDRAGRIWIGGVGGLVELRLDSSGEPTFVRHQLVDDILFDAVFTDLAEDSTGALLLCTDQGLWRFDGAALNKVQDATGDQIAVDRSGSIWIITRAGTVRRLVAGQFQVVFGPAGVLLENPSYLYCDRAGNMWFSFAQQALQGSIVTGIWRFDGAETRVPQTFFPPQTPATSFYLDRSGFFWMSTSSLGAARFDGYDLWSGYRAPPLLSSQVLSMMQDHSGRMWFGHDIGVSRDSAGVMKTYGSGDGAGPAAHMAEGHDGTVYTAGSSSRYAVTPIGQFSGTSWTADPDERSRMVLVDKQGALWEAELVALSRKDSNGIQRYPMGYFVGTVEGIAADSSLGIWLATSTFEIAEAGGVYYFDTAWRKIGGFPSENATSILVDHNGRPWVGTREGWLCRWDGERWRTFDTTWGLPPKPIVAIGEDAAGNIWTSTSEDIARITLDIVSPQTVFVQKPPYAIPVSRVSVTARAAFDEAQGIDFSFRADSLGDWSDWNPSGAWDSAPLATGQWHFIEARSRDADGNVDLTPAKARFEVDTDPPAPVISSPPRDSVLAGTVEVRGTTADARFGCARLLLHPVSNPNLVFPIPGTSCDSIAVSDGLLATWNTRLVNDGAYDLEVLVTDSLGLSGSVRTRVIVDNEYPPASVTSPVQVISATGGNIYTNEGDFHLYFGPHSFGEDTRVTVTRVSALPESLPTGEHRLGDGFRIFWDPEVAPKHPGRAERSLLGLSPGSRDFSIYRSQDGSSWNRVGGTVADQAIQLPITQTGFYAVFTNLSATVTASSSKIRFTPRVFSPSGTFADREVGISFSLPRPAPVTIRVFSRSGVLVRELAANATLSAGDNMVRWDGKDSSGRVVLDGVYLVTVQALGTTLKQTLAVVR